MTKETSQKPPHQKKRLHILLFYLWAGVVSIGLLGLLAYNIKPGITEPVLQKWPQSSKITLSKIKPTMLLFIHPHCTCSRATLEELSKLITHIQGKVSIYALFYQPEKFNKNWIKTDTWEYASTLPGVHVIPDPNGKIAQHFGTTISGQVLLYNPQGELIFNGGITPSRAHSGDNKGSHAIQSLINHSRSNTSNTFVFGCPIRLPKSKGGG